MKKILVITTTLLLSFAITYAKPKIKEIENAVDKKTVKQSLGRYQLLIKDPGKRYFNFIMEKSREGTIADGHLSLAEKNKKVSQIDNFTYEKNKVLLFRIRHIKAVHRQFGGTLVTLIDAKGKPVKHDLFETTMVWTGEGIAYDQLFIIKTARPITKDIYSEDQVPLKLTIVFMKQQKLVYSITP